MNIRRRAGCAATCRRAAAFLLAAIAAACSGVSESSSNAVPELRAELESRIGSIDDPAQALTQVTQVLIGPREELYVRQSRDRAIRRYAPDGTLTRTIGRPGEGPGEFSNLTTIGLIGDTLWAADSRLMRVSFFSLDGELLSTRRWSTGPGRIGEFIYDPATPQVLVDGVTALVKVLGMGGPMQRTGALATYRIPIPIVRIDTTSHADTIAWQRYERTSLQVHRSGGPLSFALPFSDAQLIELMPDGSGVISIERRVLPNASPPAFTVTLVSPSGDTVFSQAVPYAPVTLGPDAVRRAIERANAGSGDDPPSSAEIEAALRRERAIPATHPPVTAVVGAQDGSIWLRREDVKGDSVAWDILDSAGHTRGTLRLPADQMVLAARGDLLVARQLDDLDVPFISRYSLRR